MNALGSNSPSPMRLSMPVAALVGAVALVTLAALCILSGPGRPALAAASSAGWCPLVILAAGDRETGRDDAQRGSTASDCADLEGLE